MSRHLSAEDQAADLATRKRRQIGWLAVAVVVLLPAGAGMGWRGTWAPTSVAQADETPRPAEVSEPADAAGPVRPIFDFADVTPWTEPSAVTVERPQSTLRVGTPPTPRERPETVAPVPVDPPAPTTPPRVTEPENPLTDDGEFGDGCEQPGTLERCDPDLPEPTPPVDPTLGLNELVNRARIDAGCLPIATHPDLTRQAQAHAERQAADDALGHSGGVDGFGTWGENVAVGPLTAAEVHDGWMSSDGHAANVLNCAFTVVGFGVADGPSGRYWTEMFGA